MEDLIWKYLDDTCTTEELELVKQKLKSDEHFLMAYESLSQIDSSLKAAAMAFPSSTYAEKLTTAIVKEYESKKPISILPLPWIIGCIVITLTGVFAAIYYKGTSGTHITMPVIDGKIMEMTSWVTICFLLLLLIDLGIRKTKVLRRHSASMI
ncbi:MAG: hypothetical protein IPO92_13760 [Saprospiraceae bacterium]|nr:hypothetical protein [Saprospiraceae bacterium]